MQALQPDQATFLLNAIYLPALANEHRITRSIIEAIPAGKENYRPDDIARPALDLAWHIVATEGRFLDAVAAAAFDLSTLPMPESIKTASTLSAWYEENLTPRIARLSTLSGADLTRVVDFRAMFQLPAVMYLGFVLHHTVHHRGQLSTYLRPMGAKVPVIYGESYDSAAARKAQQGA